MMAMMQGFADHGLFLMHADPGAQDVGGVELGEGRPGCDLR